MSSLSMQTICLSVGRWTAHGYIPGFLILIPKLTLRSVVLLLARRAEPLAGQENKKVSYTAAIDATGI